MEKYRAAFISDVHIGLTDCKIIEVTTFIENVICENLFLVGDIFDCMKLKKKFRWPEENNKFLSAIYDKIKLGTNIYFIIGNHEDGVFDSFLGNFEQVHICKEVVYVSSVGERVLVTHGHEYDPIIEYATWLVKIGNNLYDFMMVCNRILSKIRKLLNRPYWSLSQWTKQSVKSAISFVTAFESVLISEAKNKNCTKVICGHIHVLSKKTVDGVEYLNCGDWLESKSAVVEDYNGNFTLIKV